MKVLAVLAVCVLVVGLIFASGCIGDSSDTTAATEQPSTEPADQTTEEEVTAPEFEDNDVDFGELL